MSTITGTIDLAKIGGGKALHAIAEEQTEDGTTTVKSWCGLEGLAAQLERGVDENATRVAGADVCGRCRNEIDRATTAAVEEIGGDPAATTEEEPVTDTTTEKPKPARTSKPTPAKPQTKVVEQPATTAKQLREAVAKAEKIVGTQPTRTTAELTDAQKTHAHKLGKAIAAELWNIKQMKPGPNATTLASRLERIEARVAERNALRIAK